MRHLLAASIACALLCSAPAGADPRQDSIQPLPPPGQTAVVQGATPLQSFIRDDTFDQLKLSPTGKYVARNVHLGEKSVLAISNRADGKLVGHFNLSGKTQVLDFWWVSDERLVISVGERDGLLDRPQPTGEMFATNADGSGQTILVGQRAGGNTTESQITIGKAHEAVAAYMVDDLPNDPRNVIVAVWPLTTGSTTFSRAETMDVFTGHRKVAATAPVHNARFVTDLSGTVRFAMGSGVDNRSKTYYRDSATSEWQLLNDQATTNVNLSPLGFSADGHTAYLEKEEDSGPNGIYAYDTSAHAMKLVLRDKVADPASVLRGPHREIVGAMYAADKPKVVFFDEDSPLARHFRGFEANFADNAVVFTDYTSDGKLAVAEVFGGKLPGDYYMFDLENLKAAPLASHREWIDPELMGERRPVVLQSRDGKSLHGYLTLPHGSDGKNLPMVVNPHGGPFGEADNWEFDRESQLLASRGYAVLQVNFRGSGGFGRAFEVSGYKTWGGAMQDDVTDATRWAIQQGIADPRRICIYGASYGGYAALMGVAKEPDLYRCAIGYVGVYDLPMMYQTGDISGRKKLLNEIAETLGHDRLEEMSPIRLADRIKVPVMLVAGREDERAPPKHTEEMRDALLKAGRKVDAKIYPLEGHGFFIDANRVDFYSRMLDFLDENIGVHH